MKKFIITITLLAAFIGSAFAVDWKEYKTDKDETGEYKAYHKERNNKPCLYNSETMTLNALAKRFKRAGIKHPNIEAKKYLLD